jgi:hypothetical protein
VRERRLARRAAHERDLRETDREEGCAVRGGVARAVALRGARGACEAVGERRHAAKLPRGAPRAPPVDAAA